MAGRLPWRVVVVALFVALISSQLPSVRPVFASERFNLGPVRASDVAPDGVLWGAQTQTPAETTADLTFSGGGGTGDAPSPLTSGGSAQCVLHHETSISRSFFLEDEGNHSTGYCTIYASDVWSYSWTHSYDQWNDNHATINATYGVYCDRSIGGWGAVYMGASTGSGSGTLSCWAAGSSGLPPAYTTTGSDLKLSGRWNNPGSVTATLTLVSRDPAYPDPPSDPPSVPVEASAVATELVEHNGESLDPVGTFSGDFRYGYTDVAIAGRGPSPTFLRSYDSADTRVGPMGPGWSHNYSRRLRRPDATSEDLLFVAPNGNTDRYTNNPDDTFSAPPATVRTLVQNGDGTYTATELGNSSWTFDASGNLTAITDRFGNTSTLGYDGQGQLTSGSDPAGRGSLTFAYTDGLLTSVTDWASPPRTVTYGYDGNDRLWTVTDRENQTTTFGYDGTSQRLTTITDARGNVAVTMSYDAQGRVATQKDAKGLLTGATTTFDYVVNPDESRVTTATYPPTSFEPAFSPTVVDTHNATGWLIQRVSRPTSTETLTESFSYDSIGNQTSVTDALGNTTNLCYDIDYACAAISGSRGNLTRSIGPAPTAGANRPVILIAYDAKNNPTQLVTPKGVPSGTSVTCATDLTAITTSYATDLAYDPTGALLLSTTSRFTDPDIGPQVAVTKLEYSDATNPGLLTRVIPPRGNTGPSPDYTYATTLGYGSSGSQAGMLASSSDALGNTTTFEYDAVGRLTKVVDPLGNAAGGVPADHRAEYVFDNEDRVRFLKAPAPIAGGAQLVTEQRYDQVSNRIVQIDANGQVTTYAYDERDGLFEVKESPLVWSDPASPPAMVITTEYAYDNTGNLSRMTRAKGDAANERVIDYAYDGRNLVRRETQYPSWPTTSPTLDTTSTYDPNGNPATLLDPLGQTTTSSYDALDRLTGIDYSDPGTPDVTYAYDANGNRTSMVDGTGSTSYAYDEADRLTSVTSPGPKTVGYRYDLDGNRTKLIYPDATAVTYSFNKASQLASLVDWASRETSYSYFPDGALETATNPNGSIATYTYDNTRRVTDILHERAGTTIGHYAYTLDAVGSVTGLTELAGAYLYGLDRLYRLSTVTGPDGDRSYTYDPVGNRVSFVNTDATTYAYDRADRITSMTTPVPGSSTRPPSSHNSGWSSSSSAYTSNNSYATTSPSKNQTRTVNLGTFGFDSTIPTDATISGVTVTVEWKVSTTSSIATLGARAWVNGVGVGSELVNSAEPLTDTTQSFAVTGLTRAQLLNGAFQVRVRATRGDWNTSFTARLDAVSVQVAYTVPGSMTLTTNANGTLVAKGPDTFAYDQGNRLTSATVAGVTEAYAYDGDGVRFSRTVGTNPAIRYVSDINTSLPVTLDDGTRKYVWGLGLAYAVGGSTLEVYHTDRLGSIRALTDATGAVTATFRTDEYGVPTASTGSSAQPFRYTGEPLDATGLTYLRARYYDPMLGRFMGRDSWAGSSTSPGSLNRFAYVLNNPTRASDPSGRNPCVGAAVVGGTVGSAVPVAGTAGGGLVGFALCAAVVVVGAVIVLGEDEGFDRERILEIRDQKQGQVIPRVYQPLVPRQGEFKLPHQNDPGKDPFRNLTGRWGKAVAAALLIAGLIAILSGLKPNRDPLIEPSDPPDRIGPKPQVLRPQRQS